MEVALGGEVALFCEEVLSLRLGGACGEELPFCRSDLGSCARLSERERCRARGEPEMLRMLRPPVRSELWENIE